MAQLNIRIDEATRAALDSQAQALGVAVGDLLRDLINQATGRAGAPRPRGYFVDSHDPAVPQTLSPLQRHGLAQTYRALAGVAALGELLQSATPATGSAGGPATDLEQLTGGSARSHLRRAHAVEEGYTGEYADALAHLQPELSNQACDLVREILTMFRLLHHAWRRLPAPEQAVLESPDGQGGTLLHFDGFDTQDLIETRLLGYARYLLDAGLYADLADCFDADHDYGNAHHRSLPRYLHLLEAWRPLWRAKQDTAAHSPGPDAYSLSAQDLAGLIAHTRLPLSPWASTSASVSGPASSPASGSALGSASAGTSRRARPR